MIEKLNLADGAGNFLSETSIANICRLDAYSLATKQKVLLWPSRRPKEFNGDQFARANAGETRF